MHTSCAAAVGGARAATSSIAPATRLAKLGIDIQVADAFLSGYLITYVLFFRWELA
jgi:hypothetical protein